MNLTQSHICPGADTIAQIPPEVAWIWSDAAPLDGDQYAQFRLTFPATRNARFVGFADSTFTLFCNGSPVGIGPDFGIAQAPRLTTFDLTPFLSETGNLVAVQVFFEGRRKDCTDICAWKAGLIGWIETADGIIPTDSSWLARRAYGVIPPKTEGWRLFANHRLAWLDLRREPQAWNTHGEVGEEWRPATVIAAHPDPERPNLRATPLLAQTMTRIVPSALIDSGYAHGGEDIQLNHAEDVAQRLAAQQHQSLIRPRSPLGSPWSQHGDYAFHAADAARVRELELPVLTDGTWQGQLAAGEGEPFLLFDFGRQVSGVVLLEIEVTVDTTIDLAYGETLNHGRIDPCVMGHSFADRLVIGPGHRRLRAPHDRAFRYLQVSCSDAARLYDIALEEHVYPHDSVVRFQHSDPALQGIWEMCRQTLHQTSLSTLVDNARRERQGWGGPDLSTVNLAYIAMFGDWTLPRKKMEDFCDYFDLHGAIPCWAPGNGAWVGGIPAHDLWFPTAARDLTLYSDDLSFGRRLLAVSEAVLAHYETKLGPEGLLANTGGWKWAEWSLRTTDAGGIDTWENLLAVQAWQAVADLRGWLEIDDGDLAQLRAAEYSQAIGKHLWHPGHQALSQGTRGGGALSDFGSQVDNALAITLNVLTGERAESAVRFCGGASGTWPTNRSGWHGDAGGDRGRFDPRRAIPAGSPFASALCATALHSLGRHQQAVEYVRHNFGAMLDEGDGAAWESWPVLVPGIAANCYSQSFGASIAYVLIAYLGGLRPLQPGGSHMLWTPPDPKLGALEVAVQTVMGEVRVRQDGKHRAWQVPAGVKLDIADAEGVHTVIGPDSANVVNSHSADGVSGTEK
jgi:hypothetical protein